MKSDHGGVKGEMQQKKAGERDGAEGNELPVGSPSSFFLSFSLLLLIVFISTTDRRAQANKPRRFALASLKYPNICIPFLSFPRVRSPFLFSCMGGYFSFLFLWSVCFIEAMYLIGAM